MLTASRVFGFSRRFIGRCLPAAVRLKQSFMALRCRSAHTKDGNLFTLSGL